jgi:hypothetical protein
MKEKLSIELAEVMHYITNLTPDGLEAMGRHVLVTLGDFDGIDLRDTPTKLVLLFTKLFIALALQGRDRRYAARGAAMSLEEWYESEEAIDVLDEAANQAFETFMNANLAAFAEFMNDRES